VVPEPLSIPDRAPGDAATSVASATAWRLRLAATSIVLIALTFMSQPGKIIGDTKGDLVLDPGGFLARSLHLWDPAGSFGQVQNQAYGYLFPMGPFFWIGHAADVPAWVVQRMWWALLLVVAFLGFVKLCGAMRVGSPAARILGGLAFALSPRMLTLIGPSSIEVWPSAVAPWVLVPLVIGLRRGNPRYYAGLSALAVASVGGVNAAATSAVLPLGVILLLMAEPGSRRRSMMIWWPAFVALGTAWWVVSLFVLGSVSPPFLDFIESSATTTFGATLFDGLRGTTNWIPYLDGTLRAGFALISEPSLIVNGTVVMVLGLWGIARSDNPWSRYLVTSAAVGLTMVTLGHLGPVSGLGADAGRDLLDGVLAPLRNTHKFDPVVRIPLVLGLVHLVSVLGARRADAAPHGAARVPAAGVLVLAGAALLGSTVPAWTADLARSGSFTALPVYQTQAYDWLNTHADRQNTLLLPASAFGDYLWGNPRDEVAQAYVRTPWSVRSAVPLAPPGAIRTLDAIDRQVATGLGTPALLATLQRSGIRYLLVRNDLTGGGVTDPETVYSTLSGLPSVERVAAFGPLVGNPATQLTATGERIFVNGGRQVRHRVMEVYRVPDADASRATAQPLDQTPVVVGSPDALTLQDGLVPGDVDVLLGQDTPRDLVPRSVVLTDTDRRRETAFGRVVDNRSASMSMNDRYTIDRPVHDYMSAGEQRWQSVRELIGARSIRASSSRSVVSAPSIDPSRQPWSAFDGDASTRWTAADPADAWIEIRFDEPTSVVGTTVRLSDGQPRRTLRVRTDAGRSTMRVGGGSSGVVEGPAGLTRTLRISAPATALEPISIDDIDVPGLSVSRPLRLPSVPASWGAPVDVVLSAEQGAPVCRTIGGVPRCDASRDGLGEDGSTIDRIVTVPAGENYAGGLGLQPRQSTALDDQYSGDVTLRASSSASASPVAGPLAMIDGNPRTGWISALRDVTPEITIDLGRTRKISQLVMTADRSLAASAPRLADLRFSDGTTRRVRFDLDGVAQFPAVRTSSVQATITDAYVRSSLSFDGTGTGLPVGISEIALPDSGVVLSDGADRAVDLPCGAGPDLQVDGRSVQTTLSASRNDVVGGRPLVGRVCGQGPVALSAGDNRVVMRANLAYRPVLVRLSTGDLGLTSTTTVATARHGRGSISIAPVPGNGPQVVSLAQNVNVGWRAGQLSPVTVNGWMQGWIAPPGSPLEARYPIGTVYRVGLAVGALAVLALLTSVWRLRRRAGGPDVVRPARRGLRAVVGVAVAAVVAALLAGLTGVVVAAVVAAAVVATRRRLGALGAVVAAGGVAAAGGGYALHPWTHPGGWAGAEAWPQWCVLVALSAAAAVAFEEPLRRSLRRIAGSSTTR
jgi:arabinofuranan 3-O-arabinosyltransferase